jgi:hypothetical protein
MNEFFDASQIVDVINVITNGTKKISPEEVRSMIVNYLIKETKSNMGEIFLIVRMNNFYQKKLSNLYIYINNKNKPINELLPQRNYDELYNEVAFYIFCKNEKQEEVKAKFSSIFIENKLNIF